MLYLVLTEDQMKAIEQINNFGRCHIIRIMRHSQWQELVDAGYCYRDGNVYRAHETYQTRGFEMSTSDANEVSGEASDQYFEDTREHMFRDGRLQI